MRTLKIIERISLDGVIQHSADHGDFHYRDWTAPFGLPLAGAQSWPRMASLAPSVQDALDLRPPEVYSVAQSTWHLGSTTAERASD
jgi:hypothetical protein